MKAYTILCPHIDEQVTFHVDYVPILMSGVPAPQYKRIIDYRECPHYDDCANLNHRGACPVCVQIPERP